MHEKKVLAFLVLQCTLCFTIRVPVDWNNDSEVKDEQFVNEDKKQTPQSPIYNEYFQYTAKKPQFAIDIAAAHGVQLPENHYKSYPIKPYTGLTKPVLGQHQILSSEKNTYQPYQQFIQNTGVSYVTPVSTSYEVFHPYKAEQPALQEIYKDPVLDKIRNDLRDSKNRLQKYENEAGESDINKNEYLESPEQTDRKKIPQRNIPAQFEIHRPQRRPIYYRFPPRPNHREQILNHKLRHPWNQNIAKVTPNHYHPVKNHLHRLRQQHALKFDDERNEYPQLPPPEKYGELPDGYDIYEKGKAKYVQLRNNADEIINKVVQKNRPIADYKLELQNGPNNENSNEGHIENEEYFVPIKNYAQVRKTETTKHLPRTAALHDAQNIEEIQNAPRLREAIKSTKAQIVYSEEGYEDAAYDHAGEQKHASDHEGHGGYLKENEISGGKYKLPSVSTSHADAKGSIYRDQLIHAEKWKDDKKENQDETESNDYSEDDNESDVAGDIITDNLNIDDDKDRDKRNSDSIEKAANNSNTIRKKRQEKISNITNPSEHDVIKRETSFKIAEFDFNSTLPSDDDILKLSKVKVKPQKLKAKDNNLKIKYPYYSKHVKALHKNSPLRYAENINLIPKKSNGGTEFYDSRSKYECSEVEDNVDPIPDKLKKDGHPDEDPGEDPDENSSENNSDDKDAKEDKFNTLKNKQRLKGLGDKIDCFKEKYFGKNPLDSPFFKEEIIENPEPVTKPNLKVFETKPLKLTDESSGKLFYDAGIFSVLEKIQNNRLQKSLPVKSDSFASNNSLSNDTLLTSQSNTYTDLLRDLQIKSNLFKNTSDSNTTPSPTNITYNHFQNKEDVTKPPSVIRQKRATPFMYEPYKIIKDSQVQDSKKTTTTSNISPLIKQLQSSRVIDKVTTNIDKDQSIKKNTKVYKDIGKVDRQKSTNEQVNDSNSSSFVNINSDKRRGEPRYELRPTNHKTTYSPVDNKRAISVEDYKSQTTNNDTEINTKPTNSPTRTQHKRSRSPKTTSRPFFDVSKYLPQAIESQNSAASNAVRKVIRTTTPDVSTERIQQTKFNEDEEYEDYENDDDDEDEEEEINFKSTTTTTTTTTKKPTIRKRIRGTTSTIKPHPIENETEPPKLRLTTRFRNSPSTVKSNARHEVVDEPLDKLYNPEHNPPKYTEKKRKSTKSTLVTDTKTYGEDDDDMTRKEVDDLLRVKQDMNEYMPHYEKENKYNNDKNEKRDDDSISNNNDDEDTDDNEDEDDEEHDNNDDDDDNDESDEEDDDDDKEDKDNFDDRNKKRYHLQVTTSEPTKRTLARTTVAPATTTETRSARIELKPKILTKKFEVHEESPINRSSPHITQFKQDIKEIEIIKEMPPKPKKKINKNLEALDLYKDENLAEEINKLGDVEVFKENLNLKSGPKHGGNYRSITPEELQREMTASKSHDAKNKGDVETSQTETRKLIELDDELSSKHHGGFASTSSSNSDPKNAKFTELSDVETLPKSMHGGNLKFSRNKGTRQNNKSAKFIELEDDDEEDTSSMHGGNFKSYGNRNTGRQMHGGNYKSAKIIQSDDANDKPRTRSKTRDARTNAAVLLNGYARAVPILTTTPAFILDPSKRMYYYVDA